MSRPPYSPEFIEYADMAGLELRYIDDVWSLETPGGEIRRYLREASGVFTVTWVERGSPEGFVMSAADIDDVDRYLMAEMGSSIRSRRRMGRIYGPRQESPLAPGWTARLDPKGRWQLFDPNGRSRATLNKGEAVRFSWIGDASLEDLRASYLDPDGAPLFVDERWHSVWK